GLLPRHESPHRRPAVLAEHRPDARRRLGPVRRRLADDLPQLARHARHALQPGGWLLQLPDAAGPSQGPGRLGADAVRHGHRRRLHAPDGDAGAAADAVDVQLEGRLLFRIGLRAAAAGEGGPAGLPAVRPGDVAADAHQPRSREPQLRQGQSRGTVPPDRAHWFRDTKDYDAREIDVKKEIKKAAELNVELPPDNADFNTLA